MLEIISVLVAFCDMSKPSMLTLTTNFWSLALKHGQADVKLLVSNLCLCLSCVVCNYVIPGLAVKSSWCRALVVQWIVLVCCLCLSSIIFWKIHHDTTVIFTWLYLAFIVDYLDYMFSGMDACPQCLWITYKSTGLINYLSSCQMITYLPTYLAVYSLAAYLPACLLTYVSTYLLVT